MTPLFAGIAHGCAAERETEAFQEVYVPRIARGSEHFAAAQLGLLSQELAAMASFFEVPYERSHRLSARFRGIALGSVGFRLRALGRLEEAVAPTRAATSVFAGDQDWENAARNEGNLSELLLSIGRLTSDDGAVAAGEAALTFAGRTFSALVQGALLGKFGAILLEAGKIGRAEAAFRDTEAIQKWDQPYLPRVYSLHAYHYCDLLLAKGRVAEPSVRTNFNLPLGIRHKILRDIGFDTLIRSRASLAAFPPSAAVQLNRATYSAEALSALRDSEQRRRRCARPPRPCRSAVALRRRGCRRGPAAPRPRTSPRAAPCRCSCAQAHLLRARIALSVGDFAAARAKRDGAAATLIKKHDYGRGAVELAVLDAELAIAANAADADKAIAAALKAVAGEPYHDARTEAGPSPAAGSASCRASKRSCPPGHAGLARAASRPRRLQRRARRLPALDARARMCRATIPRATPSPPISKRARRAAPLEIGKYRC